MFELLRASMELTGCWFGGWGGYVDLGSDVHTARYLTGWPWPVTVCWFTLLHRMITRIKGKRTMSASLSFLGKDWDK